MTIDFKPFAAAVAKQFAAMSKYELFTVNVEGYTIYAGYLAAFPAGTNPIFRERTEHDCSCCKNFIRNIGNVVAIINGKIVSVWDIEGAKIDPVYAIVAERLAELARSYPIKTIFRTSERSYGAEKTYESGPDGKERAKVWDHFHGSIAALHFSQTTDRVIGEFNAILQVMSRGLNELTADALSTVLDLITSNSLYRGEEHLKSVKNFMALQGKYRETTTEQERQAFIFANIANPNARFRNTVIGSLVIDLSDGMPLDQAVKAFEVKVAPTNYKRPTALITPRMADEAMNTIRELGLEDSLERRLAKITDISINDVLWADKTAQKQMKGGIADLLQAAATAPTVSTKAKDAAEEISIVDFMKNVLPAATSLEVMVSNAMMGNFVTLTAPAHADVAQLFKWPNDFAWSYDGNVTDSIKQRVKAAGGKTDALLRVSLAWQNSDDLDLHVHEPDGNHIYFGNRGYQSRNTGELDVDMNRSSSGHEFSETDPVENVTWTKPRDGVYKIVVNNYSKRTSDNQGFTIELESEGSVYQLSAQKSPSSGKDNHALMFKLEKGIVTEIKPGIGMIIGSVNQEKWGVTTEQFVKVTTVMNSPNHWSGYSVGQKHWLFMLDGCKNPLPVRGIYNEFLNPVLEKHRKVFEILGDKTKCEPTDDQLSGVGFNSTSGHKLLVQVSGAKQRRLYNITF